ncbi:MAG TPA: alpha/beta hydrolase [Thiobacillus sp.]|nr:MAG: alpha/beta hydrolase [Hydrogenophilales bacterium 28-61-11]OYZ58908.1 MAG: alpha/beta hydrolase [Hydrogenophilales bacterium 16-61-112]OZA46977.1 MAG: alpha/beta hydrolase [Hydrogenophilales bacterium 17-61-76]HQT30402.1 alpha/beta hydrolase [Thiobacillus sp.]HQT68986.1 alpha/beta hydrolase [Thiobacillus sp.]
MKRYKLRIPVAVGKLETVIDDPEGERRGLLLVAHPHPLHGGTLDNKVVTTLAKAANEAGWVSVRPNFRGVGMSDGIYDAGMGETEDLLAVARFVEASYPNLPWALAGFSFGAFVQHRLRQQLDARRLILVAPAVTMYAFDPVPPDSVLIYGDADELIPPAAMLHWAEQQQITVKVIPNAGHFFHGKLSELRQAFTESCPC